MHRLLRRALAGLAAAALVAFVAIAPSAGLAATGSFAATRDAYVREDAPTVNYGTDQRIRVDGSPRVVSYLRFDVSGVSGSVSRATLRVYAASAGSAGVSVAAVSDTSWTETGVTWSTAPAAGAVASSSGPISAAGYVSLDVTSLVKADGAVAMALRTPGSAAIALGSRESGPSGTAPQLVVQSGTTATPTPTATPSATPASGDPQIAAAGDIACDPVDASYNGGLGTASNCRQKAVSDLLVGSGLTGVLTLGDNQYETGALTAYQRSFDPTWGRVKSIMHPVPGNHEYKTAAAAAYFDYFNGAGQSTGRAGDRTTGYYSYDVGAWHLLALNSNCASVGGCQAGSPQEQWVRADLATHPARCTLAYWHHPVFSSGEHGSNPVMAPIFKALEEAGADVVLNGHDHDYERFAPQTSTGQPNANGIREFVVGTGGKNHYALGTAVANSQIGSMSTFGVVKLTLHGTSYDWRFTPESGSTFTDSGTAGCH